MMVSSMPSSMLVLFLAAIYLQHVPAHRSDPGPANQSLETWTAVSSRGAPKWIRAKRTGQNVMAVNDEASKLASKRRAPVELASKREVAGHSKRFGPGETSLPSEKEIDRGERITQDGHLQGPAGDDHNSSHASSHGSSHGSSHAGWQVLLSQEEADIGLIIALLLVGFVVFDMCLLYLLNHSDPQVKSYAFKMTSTCVGIFCAVLFEKGLNRFIEYCEIPVIVPYLFVFCLVTVVSYRLRHDKLHFFAVNATLPHLAAFIAIHLFGHHQIHTYEELEHDHSSSKGSKEHLRYLFLIYPLLALFLHVCLTLTGSAARQKLLRSGSPGDATDGANNGEGAGAETVSERNEEQEARGRRSQRKSIRGQILHQEDEEVEQFCQEIDEAEDESFAIVLSFLIRQGVLYAITGRVPTLDGDYGHHTSSNMGMLFGFVGVSFGLLLILSCVAQKHRSHGACHRFLMFLQVLVAYSFAWCLLSLGRWVMQTGLAHHAVQKIANAAMFSPLTVVVIIAADKLADLHMLNESTAYTMIQACGLLVGLAWEKAFSSSVDVLVASTNFHQNPVFQAFGEILLCLGIAGITLPAWKWFIVPTAALPIPSRDDDEKQNDSVKGREKLKSLVSRLSEATDKGDANELSKLGVEVTQEIEEIQSSRRAGEES
eukprot:gnl/TRDRNA2_/TRDRNA2_82646_c0_seq1.p1 gnl/TRDRNA2_/TRDRNA2_82646_c0~~gnl/TRDRNA2_/TRDRNA2_82646_c0_seq1.p1  ORF type:complete len:657 (-),score=84.77 gnl/TRDRNA2_/TRDRNA2_82646_c0_seq1:127-2097(-)